MTCRCRVQGKSMAIQPNTAGARHLHKRVKSSPAYFPFRDVKMLKKKIQQEKW